MTPSSFARAAVTQYHKLGAMKNRDMVSPRSGDQVTEIQVWAGLAPWEALRGMHSMPLAQLLVVFWQLGCCLAGGTIIPVSDFTFTWHLPSVPVCVHISYLRKTPVRMG